MIIIIGGSGFIGSRLCSRLSKAETQFLIVDKQESSCHNDQCRIADVRDIESMRAAIPSGDVLINLAAEHKDNVHPRSLYDEVNVEGAKNVCQLARERKISRIVFTSSVAVYGFPNTEAKEDTPINYSNDYGRTKWEAEKIYHAWQAEDPSRTLVIIRPTVVFGEGNRGNVYNLFNQIANNRFVMVGKGLNKKSMAYVENVAAFIEYSLTFPSGNHVYNYVDKPDLAMNALVRAVRTQLGQPGGIGLRIPYWLAILSGYALDIMAKLLRRELPVSAIRVRKFCSATQFGTSVLETTTFVPPVTLTEGLRRTIQHEFQDRPQ